MTELKIFEDSNSDVCCSIEGSPVSIVECIAAIMIEDERVAVLIMAAAEVYENETGGKKPVFKP